MAWTDAGIAQQVGCNQSTITRIRNGTIECRESVAEKIKSLALSLGVPMHSVSISQHPADHSHE